jgi:hypothetical protein
MTITARSATLTDEQRSALILLLGFLCGGAHLRDRESPIAAERFVEIYEALGIVNPLQYWPFLPPGVAESPNAASRDRQAGTVTQRMVDAAKAFIASPMRSDLHSATGDPWIRVLLETALAAERERP